MVADGLITLEPVEMMAYRATSPGEHGRGGSSAVAQHDDPEIVNVGRRRQRTVDVRWQPGLALLMNWERGDVPPVDPPSARWAA